MVVERFHSALLLLQLGGYDHARRYGGEWRVRVCVRMHVCLCVRERQRQRMGKEQCLKLWNLGVPSA